ncbi:putative mitochondrial chaperone protein [Lasiodiplodia theobromae]|uniref:ferroxidase n=2 Tax=Lasiodiplodia TaxID=66739 RepID=A0A5N5CU12_9PEZI|nr:Arabinogalactan endo-beta-galactosidase [Lasiodiplodia theobromae]KAB2568825.1 Frataxin-like protein [Lasiodiplodia theobromae]KAF4543026.1 Arabinogalactan endo-beta-galactosidase [Lasiodiplodia theobromae]KAF9633774.1 putative mitochondrial chaperone protein [Lasiodiplodia theobromae]KAK0615383.1 Frataxin-like protein [Lasiodiplodia hormozganensis]
MVLPAASRVVGRAALRASLTGTTSAARLGAAVPAASSALRSRASPVVASSLLLRRSLSSSPNSRSIIPDAEHPAPKQSEASDSVANTQPTDISLSEYHEHADRYLELLQQKLEDKQDAGEGVEVEYSAGVLTVDKRGVGTYVLNKQPPNKQIWLSSPVTGPKRFDWVVQGESMHQKADGGIGDWIYLRDGSSLTGLIRKELGVDVSVDGEVP